MSNTNTLLALAQITYGLLKITIGIFALVAPQHLRDKLQHNKIAKELISSDITIAAQMIEVALLVFGAYTLVHGLDTLGVVDVPWIHSHTFVLILYISIGVVLTLFYSLVLYTSIPIPKDKNETNRYTLVGLIGGLSFLIMTPLYILYHEVHNNVATFFLSLLFTAILICIMIIILLNTFVFKNETSSTSQIKSHDLSNLLFIPLSYVN